MLNLDAERFIGISSVATDQQIGDINYRSFHYMEFGRTVYHQNGAYLTISIESSVCLLHVLIGRCLVAEVVHAVG